MKHCFKLLFVLGLMLISMLNAQDDKLFDLYKNAGGNLTKEKEEVLKKDNYFKKAVEIFDNTPVKKRKIKDVETGQMFEIKEKVPNWKDIFNYLKKSAEVYENSISSYLGLYVINTFYTENRMLEERKLFSKILYDKEKNMCEGYINYGKVFEKGQKSLVNKKLALKIYKESLNKACTNRWQKQVIESKIWYLKRHIND